MNRNSHPLCTLSELEKELLAPNQRRRVQYRSPSTGATEDVTYYSDGSSTRHNGGPAAPMNYDEYGEEC